MNDNKYKTMHRQFVSERDSVKKIILIREMMKELDIFKKEYSKKI